MDAKKKSIYFLICAILGLIIVILFSFVSAAAYKKEQALKNPYYFCDGSWTCCSTNNSGCDTNKNLGAKDAGTYHPQEKFIPGSAYHQNCVLPVQNGIRNYQQGISGNFNFGYLYNGGTPDATSPSPYYPGCPGPGSSCVGCKQECYDPKLNPQNDVKAGGASGSGVCPYVSHDSPPNVNTGIPNPVGSNSLYSGWNGAGSGYTIPTGNWNSAGNAAYIANISGGNYVCPYKTVKNNGQVTSGNTQANILSNNPPPST